MKQTQITLLTNAQIKHIAPDYLKTIFFSRRDSLHFIGEPISVTMTMKYRIGKEVRLLFKIGDVKVNTLDELIKLTIHQLESLDKNLRYEKLYLVFRVNNT